MESNRSTSFGADTGGMATICEERGPRMDSPGSRLPPPGELRKSRQYARHNATADPDPAEQPPLDSSPTDSTV